MKCKGCGIELGNGKGSLEYCDGLCFRCYMAEGTGDMQEELEERLR